MPGKDHPDSALRIALEAKARYGTQLMAHPDVHAVGVGRRRCQGRKTDEYAVVVHLRRKLSLNQVPMTRQLPTTLRFVDRDAAVVVARVDVQEHPKPEPQVGRLRPVPGGVSVGLAGPQLGSGTLGGWVWDTVTQQVVGLSNAHVFSSRPGVGVLQPARENGGVSPADRVASVLRAGTLDAAIAVPDSPSLVSTSIMHGDLAVFEISDATIDMRVEKTGRATGLTFGIVDLIEFDSNYHGSHADLWIDPEDGDFSAGGDSGALYVESDRAGVPSHRPRVVGLHWGGSGASGVGHPIRAVFDDLGLATLNNIPIDHPA